MTDEQEAARLTELQWSCMGWSEMAERIVDLEELTGILAYCMSEDRDCDLCALNGADMPAPRISACDALPGMLREMGLEVVE